VVADLKVLTEDGRAARRVMVRAVAAMASSRRGWQYLSRRRRRLACGEDSICVRDSSMIRGRTFSRRIQP